jgi:hypothetical protein
MEHEEGRAAARGPGERMSEVSPHDCFLSVVDETSSAGCACTLDGARRLGLRRETVVGSESREAGHRVCSLWPHTVLSCFSRVHLRECSMKRGPVGRR